MSANVCVYKQRKQKHAADELMCLHLPLKYGNLHNSVQLATRANSSCILPCCTAMDLQVRWHPQHCGCGLLQLPKDS
ncbi:hypothetical protein GN956_G18515 [Arapaima gigas]